VAVLADGVQQTMNAALGDERSGRHTSVSSHCGIGIGHSPMHDGQGGKKDEIDGDAERFFRAVDRAVLEHHSRPSGLPLMLATLHVALAGRVATLLIAAERMPARTGVAANFRH
jgi:hypothetical protein